MFRRDNASDQALFGTVPLQKTIRMKLFSGGMFSMKRYPVVALVVVFFLATGAASASSPFPFSSIDYHSELMFDSPALDTRSSDEFGIKEVIPKEYQARYQKWKE